MDIQARLKEKEIFASLDNEGLDLLAGYSREKNFSAGSVVFREGDSSGVLYLVLSGNIQITKKGTEGNMSVIAELVEGDILGELEFFTAAPFNATATAVQDAVLLQIPGDGGNFGDVLLRNPTVAASVMYEFLRVFSGRLRKANTMVKENSALVQELKRQVYGDKLTGLYNKTYLEETLPALLKKKQPLGLLLMKPDNFKMINDTFGHEAGDGTLKLMSAALNRHVADRGTVLRYMGNELGVILEDRDRESTVKEAESLMKMFNTLDISEATQSKDVFLSMSIGIALYPEHSAAADALIAMAHELPLAGRARGGNVILFPEDLKQS